MTDKAEQARIDQMYSRPRRTPSPDPEPVAAEPFSREDIAGWRERHVGPEMQCPLDMQPRPCLTERWLATLNAARSAPPITATALAHVLRGSGIPLAKWLPSGVAGHLTDQDYVSIAADILAALPVREDGPTGIDDWTRLAEAWANVMDGRRIGQGLNAARISGGTTNSDDWLAIAAEYDRLTRGASHVR